MSKNKHTPTPWHVHFGGGERDDYFVIADRSGRVVADYSRANYGDPVEPAEMRANMRLIVTAVNCHRDLLAVAETFLSMHADYQSDPDVMYPDKLLATVRRLAEAAVAKAKGG